MKRAKIVLGLVAILAATGAIFAFKAHRTPAVFYSVNTTTTNPNHRLCTVPIPLLSTTIEADKAPGAPTVIQTLYFSTASATTSCPTLTIWEAE